MFTAEPVALEGHGVRLEPLSDVPHDGLNAAAADGRLWELWFTAVPAADGMARYIADALAGQRDGHMLPWAVRDLVTDTLIGCTRYHDIVQAARKDGTVRDSVMYSILRAEWPDVERHLELRINRAAPGQ